MRTRATTAFEGVERADGGDGAPIAFRIWRAGDNTTDHCPTFFSERSAALLLEQQARRGNRFSIDVNHLSLDKTAPLENQRAVGWFDIAVRDGELWAVNVEWTDTVREGVTKKPPEWKFHSPAYDVDPITFEVLSLTNLALTNNPATWAVTALASCGASQSGHSRMKLEDIKAAFDGADEEKKAAAWRAIAAAMASDGAKPDEALTDDEPEKKDSEDEPEKKDSKATKAAADEPEEKDSEDEPEKKDAIKAAVKAAVDAALAPFVKAQTANERKTLLASRPDFSPELVRVLAKAPLATVRDAVANVPRTAIVSTSTETVQATRPAGAGTGEAGALDPEQRAKLDERMGVKRVTATVKREGVHQVFPAMTPEEARAFAASKGAK